MSSSSTIRIFLVVLMTASLPEMRRIMLRSPLSLGKRFCKTTRREEIRHIYSRLRDQPPIGEGHSCGGLIADALRARAQWPQSPEARRRRGDPGWLLAA